MKPILKVVSLVGLAFTIVPSLLVFSAAITKQTHFRLMVVGLVLWFATAPFWMKSKSLDEGQS
ncbi:MAG: hypothetical protein JW955_09590 [Sedimentisphaerales bacterium]|jgi:hypothetical protein|nr:hypothetical protein [Sedimentisphaerales bacterium]